jgi:hypothetical protein
MSDKLIISYLKGGFGNQMQQYATALAIATKMDAKLKVDLSFFEKEEYRELYKMDKINVNIEQATQSEIERLKNEPNAPLIYRVLKKIGISSKYRKNTDICALFGFKPDKRITELNHSAYLSGWCSAEVYVREIQHLLIDQFQPKSNLSQCANQLSEKIKSTNAISIHIRRGDFLDLQHFFRIVPIEYYKTAVNEISKKIQNPQFFIFSNDQKWANENIDFVHNPIFVDLTSCEKYTGYADVEEFELMKRCKHNIIGNSSFSWWAAYLNYNKEKIVIAPKKWFNDKFYQESLEQYPLCPSDWLQF